jgi:hypothetical protein
MIQLNYGHLNSPFPNALDHIATLPLTAKAAWAVMKINRKVNQELKLARDVFHKTVNQFVVVDEAGQWVPKKDAKDRVIAPYQAKEGQDEALQAALKETLSITFEVRASKLRVEQFDVPGIKLSADDFMLLEPIFEDAEEAAAPLAAPVAVPAPAATVTELPTASAPAEAVSSPAS